MQNINFLFVWIKRKLKSLKDIFIFVSVHRNSNYLSFVKLLIVRKFSPLWFNIFPLYCEFFAAKIASDLQVRVIMWWGSLCTLPCGPRSLTIQPLTQPAAHNPFVNPTWYEVGGGAQGASKTHFWYFNEFKSLSISSDT